MFKNHKELSAIEAMIYNILMPKNTKNKKRVWLPDAHLVKIIANSASSLRTSDEEFEKAFKILEKYPARVTIFGSARTLPDNKYYKLAMELAAALATDGYAVVSGGSGGIMEAANRGAKEAGGHAIGFNIILPHEQKLNAFTTESLDFHYFFTRKVMMSFYAHGYVYFPGGFGTLDELFEVITLIQTKKMFRVPIILIGGGYWTELDRYIKKHLLGNGFITSGDENIYTITDDIREIQNIINEGYDS